MGEGVGVTVSLKETGQTITPIANHLGGRGSTGTNRILSQKLPQNIWTETVFKMNPERRGGVDL